MLNIQMLYKGVGDFCSQVKSFELDSNSHCLVRIYTANSTKEQAVEIAREIKAQLPRSEIIGCSCCGVIFNGDQFDDQTLVVIEGYKNARFQVKTYDYTLLSPKEIALAIKGDLGQDPLAFLHLLAGGNYDEINSFIDEFNVYNPGVRIVGGVAGIVLPLAQRAYVFNEVGGWEERVITAAVYGTNIFMYNGVNIAHSPISTVYNITKADGCLILEIEGKPAVDWCREQFGTEDLTEYTEWQLIAENDILIRFPIVLEGHNGASRFLKYSSADQAISLYYTKLSDNTQFRIGYTSPMACVQQCFDICSEMLDEPVESLFCYTCLFRKLYLENCAEWELRPFKNTSISGVFMMGEVALINGKNEFLNGSCSIVATADRETYIEPDLSVFEDLYKIKDDSKSIVNYILQKQSSVMSRENDHLIKMLVQRQHKESEMLLFDVNTKLQNTFKYAQDNKEMNFNKMCMIQVENYDLLVGIIGQDAYYKVLAELAANIHKLRKDRWPDLPMYYYTLNDSTFFVAAGDEVGDKEFVRIVEEYYKQYQTVKTSHEGGILVNRFVMILHQDDLLGSGLNSLQKSKNLQTHFILSDGSIMNSPELSHEMEMIKVISYAIQNNGVVPYFQGIYDNITHQITKYESLMRLIDQNGRVYLPGEFMGIAKKYHMYGALSRLMVSQVFQLFTGRAESVSLNLSASDINFGEMQDFIYSLLERAGRADNFVFEIVEDENLRDMDKIKPFIQRVRSYGVGFAIDDFGSGYSNFIEILMLEPDYIKIDRSIIMNVHNCEMNQKVVENISFLGKQMNALLIAEGVETQDMQQCIERLEVRFSQGYLFAYPVPFGTLGLELCNK